MYGYEGDTPAMDAIHHARNVVGNKMDDLRLIIKDLNRAVEEAQKKLEVAQVAVKNPRLRLAELEKEKNGLEEAYKTLSGRELGHYIGRDLY